MLGHPSNFGYGWATACGLATVVYRKNPKISDTQKIAVITLKVEQDDFSLE